MTNFRIVRPSLTYLVKDSVVTDAEIVRAAAALGYDSVEKFLEEMDVEIQPTSESLFDPIEEQAVRLYPLYVEHILAKPQQEEVDDLPEWLDSRSKARPMFCPLRPA